MIEKEKKIYLGVEKQVARKKRGGNAGKGQKKLCVKNVGLRLIQHIAEGKRFSEWGPGLLERANKLFMKRGD